MEDVEELKVQQKTSVLASAIGKVVILNISICPEFHN